MSLPYVETDEVAKGNFFSTVDGLEYNLYVYGAVAAAKRGISSVLDFSDGGEHRIPSSSYGQLR